jgi:16S rRNA (guanine966-N2)-methyltransferase
MRVIAGKAKGHPLKAPKRRATRPATDLVRGAIFSILENAAENWSQVLDLFSGSGALGIEALSRGADWADFIEHEPACCAIIKENLEKTKLAAQAHVYCSNVAKAISFLDKEYDIILIDPPYSDTTIGITIRQLAASRLVGASSVVVITHSPHFPLEPSYDSLKLVREYRHGDSCINIYRKESEA